jgi:hypothetical protein
VNIFAELCRGRMAHLPEITEAEARKMLRPLGCGAQAVTQEAVWRISPLERQKAAGSEDPTADCRGRRALTGASAFLGAEEAPRLWSVRDFRTQG